MIAVDTNVLVRMLVTDDAAQVKRARKLFENNEVVVATTVLLETEWVLRSAYRLDRRTINSILRGVLGLPNVISEAPAVVSQALDAHEAGLDFADALHLASTSKADGFFTFDLKLARAARSLNRDARVVPG